MGKKPYFNIKDLEEAVNGKPLPPPEDMVRPFFKPLEDKQYTSNEVFYENDKILVLNAPVCDAQKLQDAIYHEPCESEIYLSKLLKREGEPMLVVALDTEYEENIPEVQAINNDDSYFGPILEIKDEKITNTNNRKILSYQVSCYYNNQIIRLIFFSKTSDLLSTADILSVICKSFSIKALRYPIKEKRTKLEVAILAYNALADVTTLRDFPQMANSLVKSADLLSREYYKIKFNKNHAYYYDCNISIVGVQNHVPGGLKELGKSMDLPKIELTKDIISKMLAYRTNNFQNFMNYGINDSDICLLWYLLNFKDMQIPISAPALGAKIIEDAIAGDCDDEKIRREKILAWRGLKTEKKLSTDSWHNRPSYTKVSEVPISKLADRIFLEASNAYFGGMNQCMQPGFYDEETYDYDLCGCYPTAGSLLADLDYFAEIPEDSIYNRDLTIEDVENHDFLDYGFGSVKFEFPDNILFPCIAQSDENRGLIFTLKSEHYIDATWPAVRTAFLMGAKIKVGQFNFYKCKKDENDNKIYSLRKGYKKMTEFRALAKEKYATEFNKKPIQEQTWKLANNGSYGKISQNVRAKKSRDVRYDKTIELGPSAITSPAHAAYITALPRVLLCAVMQQLTEKGYICYSVTTDGFITNAPQDVLESCDGYGLIKLFSQSRMYLVNDPKVWERKHIQKYLINITTRANQGFNDMTTGEVIKNETVNAHVGYRIPQNRTDAEKAFMPDEALFTYEYLTNYEKGIHITTLQLPNLNDVVRRKKDYVGKYVSCNLKFNFDYKRKPDGNQMKKVPVPFRGENYYTMNYPTVPYDTIDEYEKYRLAKNKIGIIRDWKDYIGVYCHVQDDPLKIPTLDAQIRAAIFHLRKTPQNRQVLDQAIKYKNLEYVLAVITGTIRRSLDAYIKYYKDDCLIDGIETYQADYLTTQNWANFGKKERFKIQNYLGYAEWVENAIMFSLNRIIENIETETSPSQ